MSQIPPLPNSQPARAAILGALRRAAPAEALPRPGLQSYFSGAFGRGCAPGEVPAPAELIEAFEAAARGWRAEVLHATPGDWPQVLRELLQTRGLRCVAFGTDSPLAVELPVALAGFDTRPFDQALETWKTELFDQVEAGITSAAVGVADTGSLLLLTGPGEPRTLSLVPPLHVAVLPASALVASLPAAFQRLGLLAQAPVLPTNVLLVTGPSKTADIQQVLAYGAHGPKALVILLIHDQLPEPPSAPQPAAQHSEAAA